ncbi:MAG: YceI family protein [Bacteroidota bacterium]
MKYDSLILAIAFSLSALLTQHPCDSKVIFKSDEHGVAYCTTKGTLFKRNAVVVGKNLDIAARLTWSATADQAQVEVAVPVRSFRSGSKKRDKHVAEILGAPEHARIHFRTEWLDADMLCESVVQQNWMLPGSLELKGIRFPVDFNLQFSSATSIPIVKGSLQTTFSTLSIEVPSVGPGGMIARPHDDLQLFVQLHLEKIDGAGALHHCFSNGN